VTGPAPTVVQTSIAAPLHTPALTSRFGTVNVSVEGSTVTLRGTVNSEEDRQLAAQMAMLEPAVMSVQNDLKVAAAAPAPAAVSPR
jgi:osmotically-inducible protein OsmY